MSLFKAAIKGLFGIKKTINDSFFGEMEVDYVTVNGKKINYFSCEKNFLSDTETVDITVYSNGTSPSEQQKEICLKTIHNYPEITDKINQEIKNKYSEAADKMSIADITANFILESISIHEEDEDGISWDLEYIDMNNKVYVDVNFIGDAIDFIDMDSF